MILDGVTFLDVGGGKNKTARQAIASFLEYLERKLGARVVFDKFNFAYRKPELASCLVLAKKMVSIGLIAGIYPVTQLPDEPRLKTWASRSDAGRDFQTGGASLDDDTGALMAMLAEALERQIWRQNDYFIKPLYGSAAAMRKNHIAHIPLESFASFSLEQRKAQTRLQFTEDTDFLWTRGTSLLTGKSLYVPAQTVSGMHSGFTHFTAHEPLIRVRTTNGLATWPTKEGAQLAGALELIERDAYMIMWFNQLTLPRLDISPLLPHHPALSKFVDNLERYRFKIHCIPMFTDAPTYAMCTVIEDTSGKGPRFTVGLKAHRSLAVAIEKSATEALRARYAVRLDMDDTGVTDVHKIGHYDRVPYYARKENEAKLEFLVRGEIKTLDPKAWDTDTESAHLTRIIEWLRKSGMEAVSVPLTHSKKNVSDLHIEMVVIPGLHALHLYEYDLALGGERWKTVPKQFGIEPREEIFTAEPHPFA